MISKDDFLALYQKYLAGNCTPEELKLLEQYRDDFHIDDAAWRNPHEAEADVRGRIWEQLQGNMQALPEAPVRRLTWLRVAASVLLALCAGWWMLHPRQPEMKPVAVAKPAPVRPIRPGGNNAYLVTASGMRIELNNAQQGKVATQGGVQVNKTKEGMLVYDFSAADTKADSSSAYNTIYTPRGGQYEVVLSDGTRVTLNAESSLRFPVAFKGNQRSVELTGEAYFEVAKNKEKPFNVKANGTNVQVLGTHFNVNAYADNDAVTTTLLEGSVRMEKGAERALIVPGQQAIALNSRNNIQVKQADIDATMAWKNGYFIFRDENIVNIMKQVSRWYDVEISYADGTVQDREFGGTISRYKDINELLGNMQLTHAIHYKIEGRRVIIMR